MIVHGRVHDGLSALATIALAIWAYLELSDGVNGFRRTVGGLFLVGVVVGAFR